MLPELFTYLTTPCPRFVREMGYLHEAIAIRGRFHRCGAAWKEHLERSRAAVLAAARTCREREAVVILGSGLLLDVPLAELAGAFKEVILVDIVHLPAVRRVARRLGNVRLENFDVSTIALKLFELMKTGRPTLPELMSADFSFGTAPSLVVSLNILSQLPVIPGRFVRQRLPAVGEEDLIEWSKRIVAVHYASLQALAGDVCLIADYAYIQLGRDGSREVGSTLHGLELPEPQSTWLWQIAPLGELSDHYARELKVGVWSL
ncbi:MAG: hypothetical protein M0036_06250 [Desulfobacteraceae bacterium]|nr:hypothetical protein [Desulfobacteraceae bacterium]